MGRKQGPRKGSLQIWPRKRAHKALPRINWNPILEKVNKEKKCRLLGFIGYKVRMMSAYVKDLTPNSLTKNKKIIIPITIIECPLMKILSARFYKDGKVAAEVLNENIDKELKRKIKLPKISKTKERIEKIEKERKYDDIRVIVYSQVKKTGVKKTPDISEISLNGNIEEKIAFIKENLAKEISINNVFEKGIVDIRGITIGKGMQGPVKRLGIHLRSHKAEKGQRRAGSIGPWHPSRLTFRAPLAGQMGFFNRITYNSQIVSIGKISEKNINLQQGFQSYGKIKSEYIILRGSVQGPSKRQLIITPALRPSKRQIKKNYELIELR